MKNGQQDKRVLILDSLSLCLQKKPFDKTTIKDIADTAGVNHGLLHYYFKSKEDILINYIDYVIFNYRCIFEEWLEGKERAGVDGKALAEAFFDFMKERITLNRQLSAVFIEIWEIGMYNHVVRQKLQAAYEEWLSTLTKILQRAYPGNETSEGSALSIIAFLEGMALFSIILDKDNLDYEHAISNFRRQIL